MLGLSMMALAEHIADSLNRALKIDSGVVNELLRWRCQCSAELVEQSDFLTYYDRKKDEWQLGILGLLNGLLTNPAEDAQAEIVAVYCDDGRNTSLTRFEHRLVLLNGKPDKEWDTVGER